ncbi:AlpA family transcriptional regulator [Solimonas sp. SE-A11]|uniref:helix-turn-helix transcriptional regulator n=1 Tax=Solimonas sp. SE-A11 TaxID=3054954 RepID=UPI00259CB17D|nr:hypothetical protein [Solimonas sp. SE-A11]MDM4773046.1 hypothetical protein [Solimonas sp. SE-A11]
MESETMSLNEVAALLRLHPRSFSNLMAKGGRCPPFIRLSLRKKIWLRRSVMAWLAEQQQFTSQPARRG